MLRRLFGWGAAPQYNSVNLDTALGWLGLTSLPKAGGNTILPIGKGYKNNDQFLHITVDTNNNVEMWETSADERDGCFHSFSGSIVYGGAEPLQLVLKNTFIRGDRRETPEAEDIKRLFSAFSIGMKEGRAPGTRDNWPNFTRAPIDHTVARQNLLKYS